MLELQEWNSFYVIVGTSAGALIGLQFVVMMLIAEKPPLRAAEAGAAFATPTIIHFSAALFLAAVMLAPWQVIIPVTILLGLLGLFGTIYLIIVGKYMRVQPAYRPVFVDWLFRIIIPVAAYIILGLSPLAAAYNEQGTLFSVSVAALILLFTGIHNAWDNVAYHVLVSRNNKRIKE